MIRILAYNKQELRFSFTVKRKGSGDSQRGTRKTGGEAAAAFAGANRGKMAQVSPAPGMHKQKTASTESPWTAHPLPGALCVRENPDGCSQMF